MKRQADRDAEVDVGPAKRTKVSSSTGDTEAPRTIEGMPPSGHPKPVTNLKAASPLLSLPAEIRLQIYHHLFKFDRSLKSRITSWTFGYERRLDLGMALANRQLSEEVTHFFYSSNSFALIAGREDWLPLPGRRNSSLIEEIIVYCRSTCTVEETKELLGPILLKIAHYTSNLRHIVVSTYGYDQSPHPIQSLIWFTETHSWEAFKPQANHCQDPRCNLARPRPSRLVRQVLRAEQDSDYGHASRR
jgi:hypothetical protein